MKAPFDPRAKIALIWLASTKALALLAAFLLAFATDGAPAEDWLQLKFDSRHSGDAADHKLSTPLGLVAAVALTDAIFTSPVVAEGRVYVVDGAGVAFCLDATTLRVRWKTATRGGGRNCNNVSSPALAGRYLHFGTMAGDYYVLDAASGRVVRQIDCGEPIFSTPVVGGGRVYFATLGSQVFALTPEGQVAWKWDFVRQQLGFSGNRWSGTEWGRFLKGRVTSSDQFLCSRDMALFGRTLVVPAGGSLVWLEDLGQGAKVRRTHSQYTATLGLSIGSDGTVYRQWHYLDNEGQVDLLRPERVGPHEVLQRSGRKLLDFDIDIERILLGSKEGLDCVAGTKTNSQSGLLSFASVSLRGDDVYRCRPEKGFGLCRHSPGRKPQPLEGCYPSIASPILAGDKAVYGGLDGVIYVAPLTGGSAWSFATAFGAPISAPAAVCDGRIYCSCEDGYLYLLGPEGKAPLPTHDLKLWRIRSPLSSPAVDRVKDRFTSFADWGNTNQQDQAVRPPFALHWIRRYEGTTKHFSSFGGGRMYTHTAEGMIFAVEEETGRLLWRRYFPGVHISYTTPLYYRERLLVPQAGLAACRLRCLDAATGKLLWESPFSGSPSWNRQSPPVVDKNLAIYAFSTGKYGPYAPADEPMRWLFGHGKTTQFPASHSPLVRAYDLETGKEVWTRDLSAYGCGGDDAGICLMDGRLYYSCFFGASARLRSGLPGPQGITAAIEPQTGKIDWVSTRYSVRGGATISAQKGRLYLGGYSPLAGSRHCYVWCLNAKDGSLVWQSEPLEGAIHVVSIGPQWLFAHAQYKDSYLLDKETGKIRGTLAHGYKCTRFTFSGSCLLGPAMDVYELFGDAAARLLSTGPRMDPSECIGACVSNGRIFYTGHGAGLQASAMYGDEAVFDAEPIGRPAVK